MITAIKTDYTDFMPEADPPLVENSNDLICVIT